MAQEAWVYQKLKHICGNLGVVSTVQSKGHITPACDTLCFAFSPCYKTPLNMSTVRFPCSWAHTYSLSPIASPLCETFLPHINPVGGWAAGAARCGRIDCAVPVWSGEKLPDLSLLEDLCSLKFFNMTKEEKRTGLCEACDNPPVMSSLLLTENLGIIPLASHM